jgi:hypothetical protein
MKTRYYVTAHHCGGASVDHPCRHGIWGDPTDTFEAFVHADTEDDARSVAQDELEKRTEGWPQRCPCGRPQIVGSERWWNSVAFVAEIEEGGA